MDAVEGLRLTLIRQRVQMRLQDLGLEGQLPSVGVLRVILQVAQEYERDYNGDAEEEEESQP